MLLCGKTSVTMEKHMHKLILFLLAALSLASCGGGGGGGGGGGPFFATSEDDVRRLTNSSAPLESADNMSARVPSIVSRTDSMILTAFHGETSNPNYPTFQLSASCSGTSCIITEPQTRSQFIFNLNDSTFVQASESISLSKNGITLFGNTNSELKVYGSWMQHSTFQVSSVRVNENGVELVGRAGNAGGDLTGSAPSTSATWQGLMVGTPATGSSKGDFLQGDATLTYNVIDATLDADFNSIKNIDRNRDHTVTRIRFVDVPMSADGTFLAGLTGNRIQGGFYGPNHAEAAGVFEQNNVVGSFGARKQ